MKRQPGWIAADPVAWLAAALLGMIAAWSIALSLVFPPLPAPSLVGDPGKDNAERQMVLVAPRGDEARTRGMAAARADLPRLPLRVISLRPCDSVGWRGRHFDGRLCSLLHSYGYDDLPVLLVLDERGRVVRVSEL